MLVNDVYTWWVDALRVLNKLLDLLGLGDGDCDGDLGDRCSHSLTWKWLSE